MILAAQYALLSTTKERYLGRAPGNQPPPLPPPRSREPPGSPALPPDGTYLAPRLPLMMGAVTTLLPFIGWLITERGTVIRVGSFPWRGGGASVWDTGEETSVPSGAEPRGQRQRLSLPVLIPVVQPREAS